MAIIKRAAGDGLERDIHAKKLCIVPSDKSMPIRCITPHAQPAKRQCEVPRSHGMVTRAISTRHSTTAVLATYELLEAILIELPMSQLLEVRRVSKTWELLITQSKPLRTKLFLDPELSKCLWSLDRKSLELIPYESGDRERLGEEWIHSQALSRPSTVNPLLFAHDAKLRGPLKIRAMSCENLYFTASPDLAKRHSVVHEMYVTQPPVSVVQFAFYFHATKEPGRRFRRADGCRTVKVTNRDGVKLGHVLQAFRIEASRTPEYRLSSRLSIKVHSSSPGCKSVVWMLGAIFVNDEEKEGVEKLRKKTVDRAEEPGWVGNVLRMEG